MQYFYVATFAVFISSHSHLAQALRSSLCIKWTLKHRIVYFFPLPAIIWTYSLDYWKWKCYLPCTVWNLWWMHQCSIATSNQGEYMDSGLLIHHFSFGNFSTICCVGNKQVYYVTHELDKDTIINWPIWLHHQVLHK